MSMTVGVANQTNKLTIPGFAFQDKEAAAEGDDGKKEEAGNDGDEAAAADGDEKKEKAEGEEAAEEAASTSKTAKDRVKEAIEGIHLPKIHKPAFLKKKKPAPEEGEKKEGEGEK